jgi:hypothetical protein
MELAAKRNSTTNNKMQFWQQHNKPIELWSNEAIQKNLDYLHKTLLNQVKFQSQSISFIVQYLIIQEAKACWMFS